MRYLNRTTRVLGTPLKDQVAMDAAMLYIPNSDAVEFQFSDQGALEVVDHGQLLLLFPDVMLENSFRICAMMRQNRSKQGGVPTRSCNC